jgi:hypothetical protein
MPARYDTYPSPPRQKRTNLVILLRLHSLVGAATVTDLSAPCCDRVQWFCVE